MLIEDQQSFYGDEYGEEYGEEDQDDEEDELEQFIITQLSDTHSNDPKSMKKISNLSQIEQIEEALPSDE